MLQNMNVHKHFYNVFFFFKPFIVETGKIYIGNKKEIAESRIPELNTYMKVISSHFMQTSVFFKYKGKDRWHACNLLQRSEQ